MKTLESDPSGVVLFATRVVATGGFLFGYETADITVRSFAFILVLVFIPETKCRTFEQIERMWSAKASHA